MKIFIEKNLLLKALGHCQAVVEKRNTIPTTSHVLLTASAKGLSISATDLDLTLIETVAAETVEHGSACVQATLIYDVVKKLNDRYRVELEHNLETGQLIIVSNKSKFELPSLSSKDFLLTPHGQLSHYFNLPAHTLKYLIDSTKFAMSTEEKRYKLNGIYFHVVEKDDGSTVLRAVATDMHRLSSAECEVPPGCENMPGGIISRKTINEVSKLIEDADKPIKIGISDNSVEFSIDSDAYQAVLSSRLIEGPYPDYTPALNVDHDKTLIVPTKDFSEAVDRVGIVVNDKIRAVKVALSDNVANLSAVSSEFGKAKEEVEVDYSHPQPIDLCFNARYLLDISAQIPTEEMQLLLTDEESSIMVRPTDNHSLLFVLMPMRT